MLLLWIRLQPVYYRGSAHSRMLLLYTLMHSYVTRMYSNVLVCYFYLLVCYSYVLVCTRMLLVCTRGVLVTMVCIIAWARHGNVFSCRRFQIDSGLCNCCVNVVWRFKLPFTPSGDLSWAIMFKTSLYSLSGPGKNEDLLLPDTADIMLSFPTWLKPCFLNSPAYCKISLSIDIRQKFLYWFPIFKTAKDKMPVPVMLLTLLPASSVC